MQNERRTWLVLTAVCAGLLIFSLGCPSGNTPPVTPVPPDDQGASTADVPDPIKPKVAEPVDPVVEVAPTEIPAVRMTDAERAFCLVDVGDTLPDAQLADSEGASQSIWALRGSKATVVLFWTASGSPIALITADAALKDIQADVAEQYADQGVHVIAVNERDTPQAVTQLRASSAATFPMLLDPEGAYFQTIATERLPRLYVLDAEGKILWLDFGYSETTRDTLQRVLQYLTAE